MFSRDPVLFNYWLDSVLTPTTTYSMYIDKSFVVYCMRYLLMYIYVSIQGVVPRLPIVQNLRTDGAGDLQQFEDVLISGRK